MIRVDRIAVQMTIEDAVPGADGTHQTIFEYAPDPDDPLVREALARNQMIVEASVRADGVGELAGIG